MNIVLPVLLGVAAAAAAAAVAVAVLVWRRRRRYGNIRRRWTEMSGTFGT